MFAACFSIHGEVAVFGIGAMLLVRCSVDNDLQGKRPSQVADSTAFSVLALFGILGLIGILAVLRLMGVLK